MKALTICNPYPSLICLPETDPRHKRVENRGWPTNYRGPLLIHAGMGRSWLDSEPDLDSNYGIPISAMVFGAFVAQCNLVECLHVANIEEGRYDNRYPWLKRHMHTEGEWCWVLQDVRPLRKPVPWKGSLGLWNVDDRLVLPAIEFHENGDGV